MTIVDIHCHTFNADDLPVRGFVRRVAGNKNALARVLARAIDIVIQGMAADADAESAELDALLAGDSGLEAVPEDVTEVAEAQAEALLAQVVAEEPATVAEAEREVRAEAGPDGGDGGAADGLEGLTDILAVRRYLRWAALFGERRLALTRALASTYPEVDLFTPMLVDLLGLEDAPISTIPQQLAINDKISRVSMRGDLGAAVHPFVGLDPRRLGAIPLVQAAVQNWGCVGVKLYPLMGFRPIGNADDPPRGMTPFEAQAVDDALAELYDWCEREQVPITAHSNPSNQAHDDFVTFSQPTNWQRVLTRWPDLHLNLGHFGWGGRKDGWPAAICRMAKGHPHVYADIGNHEVGDLTETFAQLAKLFDESSVETRAMKDRFMFGTDWYMVASHRHYEEFLHRFHEAYTRAFPDGVDRFMGGAALAFLGFDDPTNHNNQRLRRRYDAAGRPHPPWLAS